MNERIKKLVWKAGAKFYSEPPKRRVTGVSMSFESVDKYTELIIQECANTIQDMVDQRIPASEYPDRLKKHFGVGE